MPRLAGGRSVTSRPASRTVPDAGRTKPASALSAVDLPDPLGPSSATVSPAATRKLKSINAFVTLRPRPYETPTRSNLIAGVWVSIGSACRVVARGRPTPTRFMPRLPLAPVLARASLRSSLAPAFGAHASAPARSGPRSCLAAILTRARLRCSCLGSRSLRSSLVPRCDPHSRPPSVLIPRLPLPPVLARASLRSSLAPAFGAHASAPARSGPRSCLAAVLTRARLRAVTSVPRRLLIRGHVGVKLGEDGVPVGYPYFDAVEDAGGSVRCGRSPCGGADLVTHRDTQRVRLDRLLYVVGQQKPEQLLGRRFVWRTLGDGRHVGQRDRGPLTVRACGDEDVELRAVVLDRAQVHLHIAVGDEQLAVAHLGLQLAGGRRRTDVVRLQFGQVVQCALLAPQMLQQDQHRGAVTGLPRRGVLQLALVLRCQQVVPSLGLWVRARVGDEVQCVVDDRHIVSAWAHLIRGDAFGVNSARHQQP